MRHRHNRFLLAPAGGQATILRRQVGVLGVRGGMGRLVQGRRAAAWLPLRVLPERRLPALSWLPGATPPRRPDDRAEGKRLMSVPISATMISAVSPCDAGNGVQSVEPLPQKGDSTLESGASKRSIVSSKLSIWHSNSVNTKR